MSVDIGTLAGRIEFEDRISNTMETVLSKVNKLDESFGGMNTTVKGVAGGFILAEVAMKAFDKVMDITIGLVEDFTTEGAAIADVEENFNRLAEGAGRAGETMLGVLRTGTHNTIDDFTLMKTVNDQFAAGIQLTDQQMKTLADGGFALAQAKGIDVAQAFDTLNTAMLTGQVRAVQQLTGKIDLANAEEKYAKILGTTSERLTVQEKQEANRIAILEAVSAATKRLGEQTDGVDEILAQVSTAWNNFYNGLISGVAASPHVVAAFLSIRDSLFKTFGDTDSLLETFLSGVNNVADFVAENAPTVIGWFGKVKDGAVAMWGGAVKAWDDYGPVIIKGFTMVTDWLMGVYNAVIATWDALPEWLKTVAERSALTAAGLVMLGGAAHGTTSLLGSLTSTLTHTGESVVYITEGFHLLSKGIASTTALLSVMSFASIGDAVASFQLLGASIASTIGPLGIAALYAAALFAAYELGQTEAVSDWFMELGLELQGFTQAEQDAMIATDKAMQVTNESAKAAHEKTDMMAQLEAIQEKVNEGTVALTESLAGQGAELDATTARTKEYKLAWESLDRLGTTWQDTLDGVNDNLRASVMEYAKLGASVEDLYQAFPKLTKAQAQAAVEAVKAAREIQAVNAETLDIINKAHGDNINGWIEGEHQKLAVTLESLKLQGLLTDEMLDAQMAKFDATIDAEISKRNEGNQASRAYYEKQVDDAQNAYDLIMKDTTEHTDREIRESARLLEDRKRDLNQWGTLANGVMDGITENVIEGTHQQAQAVAELGNVWQQTVGRALQESEKMVMSLSGEVMKLGEYQKKQLAGGSMSIKPLTKTELTNLRGMSAAPGGAGDTKLWQKLAQLEDSEGTYAPKSATDYTHMINDQVLLAQLRMWAADKERPANIPGFSQGGYGDFGTGTLAMLHGKELITPIDKLGSMGSFTQVIYVNGTAEEVARKINQITMDGIKQTRQVRMS